MGSAEDEGAVDDAGESQDAGAAEGERRDPADAPQADPPTLVTAPGRRRTPAPPADDDVRS